MRAPIICESKILLLLLVSIMVTYATVEVSTANPETVVEDRDGALVETLHHESDFLPSGDARKRVDMVVPEESLFVVPEIRSAATSKTAGKGIKVPLNRLEASLTESLMAAEVDERGVYQQRLVNGFNTYYGTIQVGTPGKPFKVIFDTGSNIFWVPDVGCQGSGCERAKHRFAVSESQTAVLLAAKDAEATRQYDISYGSGDITGVEVMDTVAFGPISVPKVGFVVATESDSDVFVDVPFDGILGMSRRNKKTTMNWGTLLEAASHKSVKTASSLQPQPTKHLSERERMIEEFEERGEEDKEEETADREKAKAVANAGPFESVNFNFLHQAAAKGAVESAISSYFLGERGGAVILGGVDSKYHLGDLHYHNAVRHVSGNWVLEVSSFNVGGHEVCEKKCLALIDTGTTSMVVPSVVAMQIANSIDSDDEDDMCQGDASIQIDEQTYHLHKSQWCGRVIPRGDRVAEQLRGLVTDPKLDGHTWIVLGEAFMQAFYTVFDNANHKVPRIGLAPVCRESQVICVGKENICSHDKDIMHQCPITCGRCGQEQDIELDLFQYDP